MVEGSFSIDMRPRIEKLPRWARVAFAARRAWRVLPLYRYRSGREAVVHAGRVAAIAATQADVPRAAANPAHDIRTYATP